MKNLKLGKIVPYALAFSFILTGCGRTSECENPNKHVHLYTKSISRGVTTQKYLEDEHLYLFSGYNWNEELIEITEEDYEFYQTLNTYTLLKAKDNWDYLYYLMSNHPDYFLFHSQSKTIETSVDTDSDGHVKTKTKFATAEGWNTNPEDSHNTGEVRLYHTKYYAYRILYVAGNYKLDKSPLVDDIREVLEDYPYVSEDCFEEVYETFQFSKEELPYLDPNDFDTFTHPDLSNTGYSFSPQFQKNK